MEDVGQRLDHRVWLLFPRSSEHDDSGGCLGDRTQPADALSIGVAIPVNSGSKFGPVAATCPDAGVNSPTAFSRPDSWLLITSGVCVYYSSTHATTSSICFPPNKGALALPSFVPKGGNPSTGPLESRPANFPALPARSFTISFFRRVILHDLPG
jgi:hypothetical protein